ncbi:transcription factor bHLH53-like [Bidens hawaiensis]|uniref:transcription factor bHLH53-like n=1 Tax=Bidens hawaiensis TaxID=980011 RepID=UPI00404A6642
MALSYFTNWSESPAPEMFSFHEEPTFYDTELNPIFDPTYNNFSNTIPSAGNFFTPSPELNNPYTGLPYFPVELPVPEPVTWHGGWYCGDVGLPEWYGQVEVRKKDEGNNSNKGGGILSAQSMAARVRRRRISEKTQELGKLVPGGHKMNTAEMFQAAFKYIKFLQAQIGVLKLMHELPESEEVMSNGEMQALVTCTSMQERLYDAEKCIGPDTLQEPSN